MASFIIHKDPRYYTEECIHFMAVAISHYPGVKVLYEDDTILKVATNKDAHGFIKFLSECDMVYMEEV